MVKRPICTIDEWLNPLLQLNLRLVFPGILSTHHRWKKCLFSPNLGGCHVACCTDKKREMTGPFQAFFFLFLYFSIPSPPPSLSLYSFSLSLFFSSNLKYTYGTRCRLEYKHNHYQQCVLYKIMYRNSIQYLDID